MFQLQILSPLGEIFSDSVDEVSVPTAKGEIAILTNHAPLFTKITEGIITIKKSGKETAIAVVGGFSEIKNNTVTILSDHAIKADDIESSKAAEAKKMAEEIINNKQSTVELIIAEKQLQKSLLELRVAEKMKRRN